MIRALAERRDGLATRTQLLAAGIDRRVIDRLIASGRLISLYPGVYAVGHGAVSRQGQLRAAVYASGPGATLNRTAAAELWRLLRIRARPITIAVPIDRKPHPGLRLHTNPLTPDEQTSLDGIPITTPLRTLIDASAALPYPALARAVNEAEYRGLVTPTALRQALADPRHRGRRGIASLRRLIADGVVGRGGTRSGLEDRFAIFLAQFDLPPARANVKIDLTDKIVEVDYLWRDQRLIVEVDGDPHLTSQRATADKRRDRHLTAHGWTVRRVTPQMLSSSAERAGLARALRATLSPTST